jgi:type I restriction enzyme, S subunit
LRLTEYRLGDLIEQRREKNNNYDVPIRGVSRDGFINAKQQGANTSNYNTFYRYDFVFNPARMEINSIALNTEYEKAICSSLYEIFYVKDTSVLLPEYLNLFIKRNEFARLCEFIGWGSAREYCRVGDISSLLIELPPLEIQQKYVDVYNAMLTNQRSYERGLEDLKLTIDANIEKFKKTAKRVPVGQLLEEIDIRNKENGFDNVKGINIKKQFIPSVANLDSVDLRKYKIVKKEQFAYSSMQTGRDECIRIALLQDDNPVIVSPAYSVLQVKGANVSPEYIMMWFTRSESDRYGWFLSDGSIRASLELSRFYEIELPLPSMPEQDALVKLYKAFTIRKVINEKLKAKIKNICPILIKGSIEESIKAGHTSSVI